MTELLNRRKTGRSSHFFFQRIGVHLTGPLFFTRKTRSAVVRLAASIATLCTARHTMTVMMQKMSRLVVVKKKIVLASRR